jgi:protein-disulfide isomerase
MTEELTKKEKRDLAKEKKREEREKEQRASTLKKTLGLLIVAVVVGFLGYKVYEYFTKPLPEVASEPIKIAEGDWTKGNSEAQVELIEYGDYQCPACGSYFPLVEQLVSEYSDRMSFAYRHFPLVSIHPNSMQASKAAEAAGVQDKFWEMHSILYERQNDWADERNVKDIFTSYAEEIGLNKDQFLDDFESQAVQDMIDADILSANSLKVNSTPTFYLNGTRIQPGSYDEFKALVDELQKE